MNAIVAFVDTTPAKDRNKLIKKLSDKEKKTLSLVLQLFQGENVRLKNEAVAQLHSSLAALQGKDLSKEKSSRIAKTKKGIQNIFGRVSSEEVKGHYDTFQTARSFQEGLKAYAKKEHQNAYEQFQIARLGGNNQASYLLGKMHEKGEWVKPDLKKAVEYFQEGAEGGDPEAQLALGRHYLYNGENEKAKPWLSRAAEFYLKSARKPDHEAQWTLSTIYDDLDELQDALHWCNRAADGGILDAQKQLPELQYRWAVELTDPSERYDYWLELAYRIPDAVKLCTMAADAGYEKAIKALPQFELLMSWHYFGDRQKGKALDWCSKAASRGNEMAMKILPELRKKKPARDCFKPAYTLIEEIARSANLPG